MMKKILLLIAVLCLFAGCKKEQALDVTGAWSLQSVSTKATIGQTEVDVYLVLDKDKTFALYQKLGEGRYRQFSGTWKLAGKVLSGSYSDGTLWGSDYEVEKAKDNLTLSSTNGEVSVYSKIEAVPEEVTASVL